MNYKKISLYILTAALLGISPTALAQSSSSGLQKANKHYSNKKYALALEQYMQVVGSNEADLKTAQRIADSYRQLQRTQEAENWYAKVVDMPGREPVTLYYYAEMLRSNGKYEEAKAQYNRWAAEQPEMSERANKLVASADFAINAAKARPMATITEIVSLNTGKYSEFAPKALEGGIIFTSDRGMGASTAVYGLTGRPYLQLFTSQPNGTESWSAPEIVQELSGAEVHNSSASATKDNLTIYYTRSKRHSSDDGINSDPTQWTKPVKGKGGNNIEIFSAERVGGSWTNVKPFAYNKADEYSVGHPALSADGNTMYFVSDMAGGLGDTDIYFSIRQADGSWGTPVNAGSVINTAGKESYPYVDDNGVLYFSSNGHAGMGGLDIFAAEGQQGSWTTVKNMGQPVNSPKNDFGIMFTEAGKKGLLSSNRNSTNGTDDIFSFNLLTRPVLVSINATDKSGTAIGDVKIDLRQKDTNKLGEGLTGKNGRYYLNGRVDDEYELRASKEGYQDQVIQIAVPESATDTLNVALSFEEVEVETDYSTAIQNIYFDTDKWNIKKASAAELDKLVALLKENKGLRVEIGSHTDSRQTRKYNQNLSNKRARSVVNYLTSRGIERSRLSSKGFGESRLLNKCKDGVKCSAEEHQLNRRTEFEIIKE